MLETQILRKDNENQSQKRVGEHIKKLIDENNSFYLIHGTSFDASVWDMVQKRYENS